MIQTSFRLTYPEALRALSDRLTEPAPGRIQLVSGPRQVGKTTLLLELQKRFKGPAAAYFALDGPDAGIPGFWERIWANALSVAESTGRAVVLLDEIHLLENWSSKLKSQWDRIKSSSLPVHVIATGSSSLQLGAGSRESLAGRFERINISHWQASTMAQIFNVGEEQAAELTVKFGGYPGAFALRADLPRWRAYVHDAIVEAAIGRDVLSLGTIRRPALLRQVYALGVTSPAQIISLQKIQGSLQDRGSLATIRHYLELLEDAYLIAALPKHAERPARQRAAPPKIICLSNSLIAAAARPETLSAVAEPGSAPPGPWLENACLAFAWNRGQQVTYWRREPYEVDAVTDGDWGRWAIEIKSGDYESADLRGLGEFTRLYPDYRPLVVCDPARRKPAETAGFEAVSWSDFLLKGPPH
ncbi:MAG: ATP-binding protein [Actinomycetota bacterium]